MSRQQIVISGLGGQGVLFLTRVIAETAVRQGVAVLTAETHGMAQRGGSVISTIKLGDFRSPLIRRGQGDLGFFLHPENLPVHGALLRPGGLLFVNAVAPGPYAHIDAGAVARELGSPVLANLVLLGFAAAKGELFCTPREVEAAVRALSPPRFAQTKVEALRRGAAARTGETPAADGRSRP